MKATTIYAARDVRLEDQPDPGIQRSTDAVVKAARVSEGDTVVVVGDGVVGLSGVLAASRMGAERVVAMSRHESK